MLAMHPTAAAIVVSYYHVPVQPDAPIPDDSFAWTARFARRQVAFAALADMTEDVRATPIDAVRRVIKRLRAQPQGQLERWLSALAPSGRAAVASEATTWVSALRAQLEWPPSGLFAAGEPTPVWRLCDDRVRLRGRWDYREGRTTSREDTTTLFVVSPWGEEDLIDARLAFNAFVYALWRGSVPSGIGAIWLDEATTSVVPVDDALLELGLQLAKDAVVARLATARNAAEAADSLTPP